MKCAVISSGNELRLKEKNENEIVYIKIKAKLRERIWQFFCNGYNEFYLNCEYGVPLWAAEIICSLKMYNDITLHIFTPYEEQARLWQEEYRDRYYAVHEIADYVTLLSTHYRNDCFDITDKAMIDKSNMILYFGHPTDKCYAHNYAINNKKQITYLNI